MPIRRRGILITLALIGLVGVSGAAAVQLIWLRLPDPVDASPRDLCRWLVMRDLAHESPDLRDRLLHRLTQELDGGIDLGGIGDALDPPARERLARNVDLLAETWFRQRSAEFASASTTAARRTMLESCVGRIRAWRLDELVESIAPTTGPSVEYDSAAPMSGLARFDAMTADWLERDGENDALARFVAAVRLRLAWDAARAQMELFRAG